MDSLVEQGAVQLGGPLGDDDDAGDALVVISADDEAGVHTILAADPWHGTVLAIKSIQLWRSWRAWYPCARAPRSDAAAHRARHCSSGRMSVSRTLNWRAGSSRPLGVSSRIPPGGS
jgi:hypothetical protein